MNDEEWINSWTTVRRLPGTFLAAKRYATRNDPVEEAKQAPPAPQPPARRYAPIADTMYILKHGTVAYRQMQAERDNKSEREGVYTSANGLSYVDGYPIVPRCR